MSFLDISSSIFSSLKKPGGRPPFEGAYIYILAVIVGYMIADLFVLSYRDDMLPTQAPPARPQQNMLGDRYADLSPIRGRNIFNPDGVIPPALQADQDGGDPSADGPATLSQLPLSLEGTLVHINPARSVATINMKNKNLVQSFMVDDEIDEIAKVTKIERRKVTFRNLRNNRLEYIEIPEDGALKLGFKQEKLGGGDSEVAKLGEFDFQVNRSDIKKYTTDLSSILNQARMVPNIIPGSGGGVEGFRFVSIQPGSIYEKLGFKPMDVIKSVNGESVNSPTKAMELYNALRTESKIYMQIERNGRLEDFNYNIVE